MDLHNLPAAIAGLTDARRPIRLRISSDTGLCNDLLTIKHVSGTEKMCGGLEYTLLCVSPQAGIPLKQFIANPVEVQFVTASGTLRSICGIVVTAAEGHSDGALATYQLIVRDAFSLLDHTCNFLATASAEFFARPGTSIKTAIKMSAYSTPRSTVLSV